MKLADLIAVAARDAKLTTYMNPMFFNHVGTAMRSWEDLVNDERTLVHKHPHDFALYRIGMFNPDTGVFTNETPTLLATAADVKRKTALT